MSGVSRLRAARAGGGKLAIQHVAQDGGRNGSAKDCAESLKAPKKAAVWDSYPKTGVPEGSESPSRGEHPKVR